MAEAKSARGRVKIHEGLLYARNLYYCIVAWQWLLTDFLGQTEMRKQKKHKKPGAMDGLEKFVPYMGDEAGGRYARVLKSTRHENLQELIVDTKESNIRIAYYIAKTMSYIYFAVQINVVRMRLSFTSDSSLKPMRRLTKSN